MEEILMVLSVFTFGALALVCLMAGVREKKKDDASRAMIFLPEDKRQFERCPNKAGVRTFMLLPNDQLIDCFVMDWSVGGLGLLINHPDSTHVRKGEQVSLKSRTDPSGIWLSVEIRHARREAAGYFVGCRFIVPMPTESLKVFKSEGA
jgi:PilZ domain-containing protein